MPYKVKSDSRAQVERALQEATKPLSAQQISEITGVPLSVCRTHLGNAINKNRAHNINPKCRGTSAYVWGVAPAKKAESERFAPIGYYTDAPRPAARAGADDFLSIPSRRGDSYVPHSLPISMAGRA